MKTIHAIWERKNLGMDAWEVTLDRKDMADIPGVMEKLHDPQYDGCYVCVKLPVGNLRMVHALEDDGFRFIETQLHLVEALEKSDILKYGDAEFAAREDVQTVPKKREMWGAVIDRITPGMFTTDRMALDPKFGAEVACRRYKGWCWDLFENPDSVLRLTSLDGEPIAFSILVLVHAPDVYDDVLGGLFETKKNLGLGAVTLGPPRKGKWKSTVSSNNLSMLRIHQNHGRIVRSEQYVFRKIYP